MNVAIGLVILAIIILWFWPTTLTQSREQQAVAGTVSTTSGVNDQDSRRQELLRTAIVGAGEPCLDVTRVFYAGGRADTGEFWSAQCFQGKAYQVNQKRDGSVRVLDCQLLRTVSGLECFVSLEKQK